MLQMIPKLVSIIIVNFNGRHLLPTCLEAVNHQSYSNIEVIIVDNGSTDGSVEYLCENHPNMNLLALERNLGFTGGNIAGLAQARGEWIVLLNNDALLCTDWLQIMLAAMETNSNLGMAASRLIIAETRLLDAAGDAFTTAFSGTKIGELRDQDEFATRQEVPGACAAAVIYRRDMLDDVGFLDEDFFLNHEDTDLNMRAWLAGWKCLYVPEAEVQHQVSTTIGRMSDVSVYYFARNTLWVWVKNTPRYFLLRYAHHRLFYEIASFFLFCFIKHKWKPFLKGKFDSLRGLPRMFVKRREVQTKVRLSQEEISASLIPLGSYLAERLRLLKVGGTEKKVRS